MSGDNMDYKREIINTINSMSGGRAPYEVFCDWVKLMALSMQNSCCVIHDQIWNQREDDYIKTIKPYGAAGWKFADMFAMLVEEMEEEMSDVLGDIYMEGGMGNKNTGQFFTPFHVSYLCARMSIPKELPERITLNEPSCGGGGMIIAVAKVLRDRGIDYQRRMNVVAQDLDWKAVYMCYVQLSLLGIQAEVVQGDTLCKPYIPGQTGREHIFFTPGRMGIIL